MSAGLERVLTGSWRGRPSTIDLSEDEFARLLPLLLPGGLGGLAWQRLRHSPHLSAARQLRQSQRDQALQNMAHEEQLGQLFVRLRDADVEPLLVKGWSVSRLYAQPGLRPCGDIDLCVRPDGMAAATQALVAAADSARDADLHEGVADLEDRSWAEIFRRSRLVRLEETEIRILCPEDQLRHLCLHLVRHGAFRPLWICDVAVVLESLPADFDWDYCLRGQRWLTDWVVCTIGLAQRLLEARVEQPEIARRARALPGWLASTVLRLWDQGLQSSDVVLTPFTAYPRSWAGLRLAFGQRWPNPIRAAYKLRLSPFTRLPPPLVQFTAFCLRAGQYAASKVRSRMPGGQFHRFEIHPAQVR